MFLANVWCSCHTCTYAYLLLIAVVDAWDHERLNNVTGQQLVRRPPKAKTLTNDTVMNTTAMNDSVHVVIPDCNPCDNVSVPGQPMCIDLTVDEAVDPAIDEVSIRTSSNDSLTRNKGEKRKHDLITGDSPSKKSKLEASSHIVLQDVEQSGVIVETTEVVSSNIGAAYEHDVQGDEDKSLLTIPSTATILQESLPVTPNTVCTIPGTEGYERKHDTKSFQDRPDAASGHVSAGSSAHGGDVRRAGLTLIEDGVTICKEPIYNTELIPSGYDHNDQR